MISGVIHLVPSDRGTGGGHLPIPRQIMTLLVHIHCRGGIFTFGVDKITVVCGNNILVVHFEIADSPHTTIGGDMRLEVTCSTGIVAHYHNGTHPCGRRIIGYVDVVPVFLITMVLVLIPAGIDMPRPLTAKDGKRVGVIEVPHQLACALDIFLSVRVIVAVRACRIHHDVAVGDINVVPFELPSVTELHIIAITVDVDGNRSIVGNVLEVEHHAGITNVVQQRRIQIEHLQLVFAVASQRDFRLTRIALNIEPVNVVCVSVVAVRITRPCVIILIAFRNSVAGGNLRELAGQRGHIILICGIRVIRTRRRILHSGNNSVVLIPIDFAVATHGIYGILLAVLPVVTALHCGLGTRNVRIELMIIRLTGSVISRSGPKPAGTLIGVIGPALGATEPIQLGIGAIAADRKHR